MLTFSATCIAIALADERGALRLIERPNRLGGSFVAISDDRGVIEVADDMAAAKSRIAALRERRA